MPVPEPNHDDGCIRVLGEPELLVWLDVDWEAVRNGDPIREERGADAPTFAIVRAIADDSYGRMHLPGVRRRTRRDGVQPWSELWKHGHQLSRVLDDSREFKKKIDDSAAVEVLLEVYLLLGNEKPC